MRVRSARAAVTARGCMIAACCARWRGNLLHGETRVVVDSARHLCARNSHREGEAPLLERDGVEAKVGPPQLCCGTAHSTQTNTKSQVFSGYALAASAGNVSLVSQPTRAEVSTLLQRAKIQLHRAQELHEHLKTLMARFDHLGRLGIINRRKVPRTPIR
jgi:hypothetical protein